MGVTANDRVGESEVLLDIDGLATRLGVTTRFVRRLVEERRVPYLKIGRLVRFDPSDVESWIGAGVHHVYLPERLRRRQRWR
jgi:excisionase family DNA binding protein